MIVDPRQELPQPPLRDTSTDTIGYAQAMAEARAAQAAAAQIVAAFPDPKKAIFIRMRKTGVRLQVNFEMALDILLRHDGELVKP